MLAVLLAVIDCPAQEKTAPRRRVAVLGFKNLRNDENTDWVGAVTAETLTTKLAEVRALSVIRRDEIQKVVRDRNLPATVLVDLEAAVKIGRILGAQSVVVGSFAAEWGQVRLDTRIVDVGTGQVLDTVKQNGAQADMDLPVSLAEKVVQTAGPAAKLSEEEKRKVADAPTASAEAYEAYGRGVDLAGEQRWKEAQAEFEKAVKLDPSFALAWLELGRACDKQDAWARATKCLTTADRLFRDKPDEKKRAWTLMCLGWGYEYEGRWGEALRMYKQSLAMSRRLGDGATAAAALGRMAAVRRWQKRYGQAMKLCQEALALRRSLGDEPGTAQALSDMARTRHLQGRHAEVVELFEEPLAIRRRLGDDLGAAIILGNMGVA